MTESKKRDNGGMAAALDIVSRSFNRGRAATWRSDDPTLLFRSAFFTTFAQLTLLVREEIIIGTATNSWKIFNISQ